MSRLMSDATAAYKDIYFTVRDGLRLYARHYPATHAAKNRRPVLCLAGLTRNSRDFHRVACALAQDASTPRDVYTLDTRGRGLSEHDKNWKNYTVPNEMQDVLDFMTMKELTDCAIIGTSRGGLITMVMAAAQPSRIGAAVLNDIGPVIETDGLMRIAGYVGKTPIPKSWKDAARVVHDLTRRDFPTLTEGDAEAFARQIFNERNGRPVAGYDTKIAKGFSMLDGPMPQLWPQFAALKNASLLVIRGANSDLLSDATVAEMTRRHPDCSSHVVPNEGHAPLLWDTPTITAISVFFAKTDAKRHVAAIA